MPLMTMTSDLSWYGNPGWTPNANAQSTDFTYNGDLTVTAIPRGFNQAGHQVSFIPKTTVDAFPIDTALGPNGSAKRKAQRGNGSLFPIGPQGQVHMFDTKRTGWYIQDRYGDTFGSKTLTGLAATYTTNSPIDDMYNRFNVRDEVHDPYGYAKPPFILRGIQREGSSDTQRWGLAGTTAGVVSGLLDIPRGGPLTTGERIGADVLRIGKFLIRPNGLAFIAKQQLLRLMSPNVEGPFGSVYKLNPQKIYNPVNTLLTVAGSALGLRFRNYGLLPLGGISRYEDIHRTRDIAEFSIRANRLLRLNNQRTGPRALQFIPTWNALSGPGGPDSVGGLGFTDFKKNNAYDTYRTNDIQPAAILDDLTAEYDNSTPYINTRSGRTAPGAGSSPQQSVDDRIRNPFSFIRTSYTKNSLYTLGTAKKASAFTANTRRVFIDSLEKQLQFHSNEIVNYGDANVIYLRTHAYNMPYIGNRNDNAAPITNNTQVLTNPESENELRSFYSRDTNYTLKKKAEDTNFTGIPEKSPNPAKASDDTPEIAKYKTLSYRDIPNRDDRNTLDFSIEESNSNLSLKKKAEDKEFTGIPTKAPNPAKPADNTPAIAKYKTLSYGAIPKRDGRSNTLDFREESGWQGPTLENKYGYKKYDPTTKRNGNPNGPIVSQPDSVNNAPIGSQAKDLIKFNFAPINATNLNSAGGIISFRAYLGNLSDQFSPSWEAVQDQGRADAKVRYAAFERMIDLDFKVVVHSAAERRIVWQKLAQLAKITYPAYSSGFYGIYIKVTIGDLYVNQPMYITSLSYNWDSETPWEIDDGSQIPLYTDINMSLSWIGQQRPDYKVSRVFNYGG